MREAFLSILLTVIAFWVAAQQSDSATFSRQKWPEHIVKKGIIWKQAHFEDLFGGQQEINIVEINLKKYRRKLRLAGVSRGTKLTSTFAVENKAIVAINGGFFDTKIGGAQDFIKINKRIVNISDNDSPRSNAYLAFDKNKINIIPQTQDSIREMDQENVLLSGPLLMANGQQIALDKNKFNDNKHPRTTIALKGDMLIFLTVDGRNRHAHGVNLNELTKMLAWYGCTRGMNLDGGGSTTMYIKGQPDNSIVNYPSDNKIFDHLGERPVANIIYIKD